MKCSVCESPIEVTVRVAARDAEVITEYDPATGLDVVRDIVPAQPADLSLVWSCCCDGAVPVE